jgi:hypothetical protein
MATRWHPEEGRNASPVEIELMASVLEGRHGVLAAEIAEFLAAVHREQNDPLRGRAWATVADAVRKREQQRLL